MQERHKNRKLYFHELAQTSQKYFIPYIKQFKQLGQDSRILEIGCGDGGNLLPFAQMGYYTLGVDISERRIADAQKFFTDCNAKGDFLASDVFLLEELYGTFDVIICHDVIEHIGEKKRFLSLLQWHCLYVVSCMADAFWWTSADMQKQGHKPFTVCPSLAQSIVPFASESMCRG